MIEKNHFNSVQEMNPVYRKKEMFSSVVNFRCFTA